MRPVPVVLAVLMLAPLAAVAPTGAPLSGAGLAALDRALDPAEALVTREPTTFGALTTIGWFSGEPNVAAGPDGTVYVSGLGWQGTVLYRRLPGASTFSYIGTPNYGYGGNDESIAVGPDGGLWISGMYGYWEPTGACASAVGSRDRGDSWGVLTPRLCDLDQGIDRQWITVDRDGNPWVTVHEVCCSGQHTAYRSTDGGATWSFAGLVAANGAFPGNAFASHARGFVYQATTCTAAGTKIGPCLLGTPIDSPLPVWAPVAQFRYTVAPSGLAHLAGAADDAGNLYLAWIDKAVSDARAGVYLAQSRDGGLTWSTPARISDKLALGTFPWVAAGRGGDVAVVWYETNVGTDPNFVPSTAEWHAKSAVIKGWTGATMPAPTVEQLSSVPLKRGPICTMGASCYLNDPHNRELLDFFEATVGPSGMLHVVWPDSTTESLRIADVDVDLR